MDNHTYNIIKALSKKAQGLWRYDQYLKDSENCEECQRLWKKLKGEDSAQLNEIKNVLKKHIEAGEI